VALTGTSGDSITKGKALEQWRRTMKQTNRFLVLAIVLVAQTARADRGSIPFKPGVQIFEPNQRAMIAWNGREEILLLSTDLKASQPTKVLEVIPLPAEPKVVKGDVEVFRKATELINRKLPRPGMGTLGKGRGKGAFGGRPAGEVTFHKKIGPHDVSVTRVLDRRGFMRWVEDYLKKAGVDNPTIPPPLQGAIAEYLRDDYRWFVFDVVDLDTEMVTNDAIQYRFASDCVYYPLRITRAEEGRTSIRLLVLTPRLLSRFPGLPAARIRLLHQPIDITSAELRELNEDMDALLEHRPNTKLRIWEISGWLSKFEHDLIAE
jgi:hypothetical protein